MVILFDEVDAKRLAVGFILRQPCNGQVSAARSFVSSCFHREAIYMTIQLAGIDGCELR
jgi:hypothetical protein